VLWRGEGVGAISGGQPFSPRVRLLGELGHEAARQRAQRRLEAFVASQAALRLASLRKLEAAVAEGKLKGLARGIAYRLIEAGGVIDRASVRDETRALSQVERRALRALGVRIGAFSIFMPTLLQPAARSLAQAVAVREAPDWRPPVNEVSRLPEAAPTARALAAHGLRAVHGLAVPVERLERLDEILRAAPRHGAGHVLSDQARQELGWSEAEAQTILRGLGFAPANRPKSGEPLAWRRRAEHAPERPRAPPANSPFAALAALRDAPPRPKRRPRHRRKAAAG
jgi:ATP-dependent RNA helicase SUPV3L1/SUV3